MKTLIVDDNGEEIDVKKLESNMGPLVKCIQESIKKDLIVSKNEYIVLEISPEVIVRRIREKDIEHDGDTTKLKQEVIEIEYKAVKQYDPPFIGKRKKNWKKIKFYE